MIIAHTAIIGARWDKETEDTPARWVYPMPIRYVKHFKTEGIRRLYEAGKVGDVQAYVSIPVFRGESYREANRRRSYARQDIRFRKTREIKEIFIT